MTKTSQRFETLFQSEIGRYIDYLELTTKLKAINPAPNADTIETTKITAFRTHNS
jgi:hypothetical protein